MNLDLKGKIAIVTGGSEGIGRSISETLSREGVKVSICSRRFDILNDAAIDITKRTGVEVLPIQADITNVEDINNLVNSTVQQLQEQMNYAYGYSAANSTGFVNIPIINPIFGKLSGRLVTDIDTSQLTVTVNTTAAAAATGQIFLARDVTNLPVPAQVING